MGTTGQSITLANSIIGVGILAMPFCFQQCGVLLATLILLFMGLISRLCCYFLLKSALLARRRNFEFLAFHVFGSAGKMAVEVGIIGFLMGTCIAYFVVVGDLGPQIVAKMFNINQSDILRTSIMVIVSLVCVLPLGLLRNVDSLSNVSAATIGFYFCLVIKVVVEAATQLMTSDWHRRVEMWRPAGLLQCVPIFSMALFCQTQLFELFESLPTLSLEKMNVVTKNAINICTGVYFTLGLFGYIAFCSQDISGNILMSLSPTMGSDVIKLGFVMSLAFSFPLIIFPCRASLYSFLYKKVHSSQHDHIVNHSIPETRFRCITVAIIAVALSISLLIPNIELVLGLVGSTIGVLICVVFPAACFVNVTFKDTNERVLAKGVLILGLIIMVLGTYANLEAAGVSSGKLDKYEEKYTQERIDKIVEDFFENRDKDDVYPKPKEIVPQERKKLISKTIIKESEVQPPNPVPPESHSNEKLPETKLESLKSDEKNIVSIPERKEIEKVSVTHPKNLKKMKPEALPPNGIGDVEPVKPKEDKTQSNEDKIDIKKQQELIETIKQHGEEQKELMKEQKEILDEIIKTKKELEQNKNDADNNDAKKIAVESIKQIANMAIQSLGGVTEKPVQVNNDNVERLEKLTNEAVQEIAKKAVETIEAIQDIKETPDKSNIAKQSDVQNNERILGDMPTQNNKPQSQVNSQIVSSQNNASNKRLAIDNQNIKPSEINPPSIVSQGASQQSQVDAVKAQIPRSGSNSAPDKKVETQSVADIVNPPVNMQLPYKIPNVVQADNEIKPDANKNAAQIPNLPNKPSEDIAVPIHNERKQHSHSQDEPQSYKQGEDAQVKQSINKIPQNVPLAVAMNDLLSSKQIQEKEAVAEQLNDDIKVNAPVKAQSNDNVQPSIRQKREVMDCTEKVAVAPKDKEICDRLVDGTKELLLPVDMNEVALPKSLPMDANVIHHISRTLKSYDEDQR